MSKTLSPTARTIKLLEEQDWIAADVEKWIPHTKIRVDLFGVADVIAFRGHETLLVQATTHSGGNSSSRVKKLKAEPRMHKYLVSGLHLLQVWAWRELKSSGRWEPKVTVIVLVDLDPVEAGGRGEQRKIT